MQAEAKRLAHCARSKAWHAAKLQALKEGKSDEEAKDSLHCCEMYHMAKIINNVYAQQSILQTWQHSALYSGAALKYGRSLQGWLGRVRSVR